MAKSKNHTANNQTRKDHRNGIKKPKRNRYISLKGVSIRLRANLAHRSILSSCATAAPPAKTTKTKTLISWRPRNNQMEG